MMLYLHNAIIIDPANDTETQGGLLIKGGQIVAIYKAGETPTAAQMAKADVLDCQGKFLAPGIVDIGAKVCEPGERHKESFRTAGMAAAAGGVTTLVTRPDTIPVSYTHLTLPTILRV